MDDLDKLDPTAIGSDAARSSSQLWARRFANAIVGILRLNSGGYITTEIVQKIDPISRIPTAHGEMLLKSGHGRLRWRALSFYEEEPQTIEWMDSLSSSDVLWDIGANVGAFSIYAALERKCQVYGFEPEAQNFALLIENIMINEVQNRYTATNIPLSKSFGLGKLFPHAMTKGGAYNQFFLDENNGGTDRLADGSTPVSQLQFGISIDELIDHHGLAFPTHIKIDVDGNEPDVIDGALRTLEDSRLKGILIELDPSASEHMRAKKLIKDSGFEVVASRSNWEYRKDRSKEDEHPQVNVIFARHSR
jgi:FkbM family methyltransferase